MASEWKLTAENSTSIRSGTVEAPTSLNETSTESPPTSMSSLGATGFISNEVRELVVDLIMNVIIQISLRVLSIVSNIVNILIFAQIGLDDGVTVTFFALAVSDLMWSIFGLSVRVFTMTDVIFKVRPYVRLRSLAYILSWYTSLFADWSMLITLFLSVQKCACVAVPLLFKHLFTARRCILLLICVFVAVVVWYAPILSSLRMVRAFDKSTNSTRLRGKRVAYFWSAYALWQPVNKIVLPAVSLSGVSICVLILVTKLRQAIEFRQAATVESQTSKNNSTKTKEVRVIQAVVLVSTIFVVCYTPDIIRRLCEIAFPMFREKGPYNNIHTLVNQFHNVATLVNSSVNVFVYLKFNSRYRQLFLSVVWHRWALTK
ncbi:uncharacterized protein LOC101855154 [Aplysia californica]|uniref:Uncharacterized protein LOC101855154 n=1 Tax=Aplysia californica TaxID=6500 RepID=A0ABM0JB92_APLCA|nr:uncharacterized protein LOC101855154 [Aplysia californica]